MRFTSHQQPLGTGVLLVNLGTPEAPSPKAIRSYLREFLSDERVVDLHPWLWWPILNGIILRTRPKKLAAKYAAIWTERGSPLLVTGLALSEALQQHLAVPVALAMRYGSPSIGAAIAQLQQQGAKRIVVLPLFPQYSASTTAAVLDAVFGALQPLRWLPELVTLNSYHDHPAYIQALAHSVQAHWQAQGRGEHLLMSFHGIPQRYFDLGDPYYCHCHKTARLLAAALGLTAEQWSLSFQSRFGREPWLQPYTDAQLNTLAERGITTLDVIAPGFAADCLETLEEIAEDYHATFAKLGGQLRYIPALNASSAHVSALAALLAPQLTSPLRQPQGPVQGAA